MPKQWVAFLICLGLFAETSAYIPTYNDSGDFWVGMEFLYGKIQDANKVIPFVVEGPTVPNGTPVLGVPGYEVVLGDKKIDSKWRTGAKFAIGFGCNEYCSPGVEVEYFFLGKASTSDSVFSTGNIGDSFFAVPYINSLTGLESSAQLSLPGTFQGKARLRVSNSLQGAELNSVRHVFFYQNGMDIFGGIRYLNFNERLQFSTDSALADTTLGNVYTTEDKFNVDNNFYGLQIGANYKFNCNSFLFNLKAKLAVGAVCQSSHINGSFSLNDFTDFTTIQKFEGGYFALPSNIGTLRKTRLCVVPEVNVKLGYEIVKNCSFLVGYDFLYISNMARSANQLNRTLNPTQSSLYEFTPTPVLVGTARPKGSLHSSNFWVQGVNFTIECIF